MGVLMVYVRKNFGEKGRVYLSLVQGYRDNNGEPRQKIIENLGYVDELQKIYEDPIAHFKEVAKQKTLEYDGTKRIEFELSKNEKLISNTTYRKNVGYAIPKKIYNELNIGGFFQSKQRNVNVQYNLNSIFSLLVFNRILFPSSKKKAFESKDRFFERFNFELEDIYRALTYFNNYSAELQKHLNEQVVKNYGRDNSLGYYDVTNFYFEIPYEDEDTIDENGELVKKGHRQKGPGKEHRPDPIRQMGLLMDSRNFPMAFHTFSGREAEKVSLLPILRRVKRDYGIERIVTVADRGLNTSDNTYLLAGKNDDGCKHNDGYVYGQSVLGADKEFKEFVLKEDKYITEIKKDKDDKEYTFKSKSRIYGKKIVLKDSKGDRRLEDITYQRQVVYWSSKYAAKQKKERDLVIAKAKDLINDPVKYNKATSYGAAGYINNIKFVKDTGEIPDGLTLSLKLDKIAEEEKYDGYYSIVTSERHLSTAELIKIYGGLWEIEESFRIMKSEFKTRPIYVSLEEHIDAHFLICFVSLLIFRILEFKLGNRFTTGQIREALINYECSYLNENYYLFDFRNEVIEGIEQAFKVNFSSRFLKKSEIKKILET
jgi:transposase